jgi:hypothetical protein
LMLEGLMPESLDFEGSDFKASGFRASDFNGLDAGLCESLAEVLLAALPDFFATAVPAFAAGVLAAAAGLLRAAFFAVTFLTVVLEDFLRVFLDIRLPFVAFGGSTMGVLRVLSRTVGFAPIAGQV